MSSEGGRRPIKYLLAPSIQMGEKYLGSHHEDPRDWKVISGNPQHALAIRGNRGGECEFFVMEGVAWPDISHRDAIIAMAKQRGMTVEYI